MLRRTRVAIVLGAAIMIAFVPIDTLRLPPGRYRDAIVLRAVGVTLLACLYPLAEDPVPSGGRNGSVAPPS
jgi:hypothetical protein